MRCSNCPLTDKSIMCPGEAHHRLCTLHADNPGVWRQKIVDLIPAFEGRKPIPRPVTAEMARTLDPHKSLVVSRYREDVDWLRSVGMRVYLYNKGEPVHGLPPFVTQIMRPNTGREAETMLHHIVTHYDRLTPHTIFTQAEPFSHCPDFLERIKATWVTATSLATRYLEQYPAPEIKALDLVETINGFEVRYGDARIQTDYPWFNDKAWHYIFDCPVPEHLWFGYSATWSVPDYQIRWRPIEFYMWLQSICDSGESGHSHTHPCPINPWSLEAMWKAIWSGPLYPIKTPPVVKPRAMVTQSAIRNQPRPRDCNCGKAAKN